MDLLNEYLALTTDEARAEFLARLTPEQLETLETEATARFAELEAEAPSDENVAELSRVADVLEVAAGEVERREAVSAELETQRQAVIDRVRGQEGGEGTPTQPAEGEGDGESGEGQGTETQPDDGADAEGEGDGESAQAPESIAAAGLPRSRPRLGQVRANARPAGPSATEQPSGATRAALTAAAEVPGYTAGQVLVAGGSNDLTALGEAMLARLQGLGQGRGDGRAIVASAQAIYPDSRVLSATDYMANVELVTPVLDAVRSGDRAALVAAGGYCAPATIRYDLPTVGDNDRPVRDALPSFQAPRGRARWIPSPVLADVPADAISDWTNAQDIEAANNPHVDPDDDVTKPCARIECPDDTDLTLEAIVRCLEFGNFNARTFPELLAAYQALVGVAWARHAEQKLLAQIDAGSRAVTSAARGSATVDLLSDLDRLVSGLRGTFRVRDTRVRVILPDVYQEMVRTDLALQMPGGNTFDERYAIASAALERWFAARNINVTWTPDSQITALVADGGVVPAHPTTVVARVFIEGTWGFVDGGTLDLGVIRDSGLVAINSFREFSESWEVAAKFRSEPSYVLTSTVCVNGTVSGTTAITC